MLVLCGVRKVGCAHTSELSSVSGGPQSVVGRGDLMLLSGLMQLEELSIGLECSEPEKQQFKGSVGVGCSTAVFACRLWGLVVQQVAPQTSPLTGGGSHSLPQLPSCID